MTESRKIGIGWAMGLYIVGIGLGGFLGYNAGYWAGNNKGPKLVYLLKSEEGKAGITTFSDRDVKSIFIQQPDYSFKRLEDIKKEKLSEVEAGSQKSKEQVESEIEKLANEFGR